MRVSLPTLCPCTVKGYALVNLDDKTLVGTGLQDTEKSDVKALNAAVENYINALKDKGVVASSANADDYKADEGKDNDSQTSSKNTKDNTTEPKTDGNTVSGKIEDIKTSVNDGNTVYYLKVGDKYYYIKVTDCMDVLLMNKGDTVTITFENNKGEFVAATSIKK